MEIILPLPLCIFTNEIQKDQTMAWLYWNIPCHFVFLLYLFIWLYKGHSKTNDKMVIYFSVKLIRIIKESFMYHQWK